MQVGPRPLRERFYTTSGLCCFLPRVGFSPSSPTVCQKRGGGCPTPLGWATGTLLCTGNVLLCTFFAQQASFSHPGFTASTSSPPHLLLPEHSPSIMVFFPRITSKLSKAYLVKCSPEWRKVTAHVFLLLQKTQHGFFSKYPPETIPPKPILMSAIQEETCTYAALRGCIVKQVLLPLVYH